MNKLFLVALAALACTGANAGEYNPEMLACRQDFEKHCFTVEQGGGRQLKCLYDIRDKIAPACASIVKVKYERYVKLHHDKKSK